HPAEIARQLALQKARRIGARDAQRAEIVELDGLQMASIHIHMTNYDDLPRQFPGRSWPWELNSGTLVIYADEPREELLDAAFRSAPGARFPRRPCCNCRRDAGPAPARDRWTPGSRAHALWRLGAQRTLHRLLVRKAAYDRTTALAAPVRVQDVALYAADFDPEPRHRSRALGGTHPARLLAGRDRRRRKRLPRRAHRALARCAQGHLRHSAGDVLLSPSRGHPPPHLGQRTRHRARAGEAQLVAARHREHRALRGPCVVGAARGRTYAMTKSSGTILDDAKRRAGTAEAQEGPSNLRSPLAKVLGQGSAKEGVRHWWAQRLTSVALVPLTIWFVVSLLSLPSFDHATVVAWIGQLWTSVFLILLV